MRGSAREESEDGTVMIDGVTLTVGELQTQSRASQANDMSFRNMVNSYNCEGSASRVISIESQLIDHLSAPQLDQILKDGGMYQGQAAESQQAGNCAGESTSDRQPEHQRNGRIQHRRQRGRETGKRWAVDSVRRVVARNEMFGNIPDNISRYGSMLTQELARYQTGLADAKRRGVRG